MACDRLLDLLALTHQPQDQKQSHQGGDEVGKRHFPGSAVVPPMATLLFDDDDRTVIAHAAIAFFACLQASSISAFEGRLKE